MLAIALLFSGCFLTPAANSGDYRNKAGSSATAMVSNISSAIIATRSYLAGKITLTVTNDLVSDAEMDASSVITAFDSRQPPNEASANLMRRIDGPLHSAMEALTLARIAIRVTKVSNIRAVLRTLIESRTSILQFEDLKS